MERVTRMKFEGEQVLLRVHLRNTDRTGLASTADALVERALAHGLAGGTVLRGVFGLDATGGLLETRGWSLIERLPVVVEIIDGARAIGGFLPIVGEVVREGLATLERARVLVFRRDGAGARGGSIQLDSPDPVAPLSTLPSPEEFAEMKLSEEGRLLRIFIGESDVWEGVPLYRAIVLKAKELGLAGATVLQGSMGFGANSRVHSRKLVDLSTDLPIVVEIVDAKEKVERLLPFLDGCVSEGLITLEAVQVLYYRHNDRKAGGGA
jgi:PII-like signaling protein